MLRYKGLDIFTDEELLFNILNRDGILKATHNADNWSFIEEIYSANDVIYLTAAMKKSHIPHITKMGKDHPLALKFGILAMMLKIENPKCMLQVINMSYDQKRRRGDSLFKEMFITPYKPAEIAQMIDSLLESASGKKPSKCKNLDWYKDGGINRATKCERCNYRTVCNHFDTVRNTIATLL